MPLVTTINAGDPGHPGLHTDERTLINTNESGIATINALLPRLGIDIVETSTGVWSGDAPARAAGVNRIEFFGWSDPADPTNGITTPANIQETDGWTEISAPA